MRRLPTLIAALLAAVSAAPANQRPPAPGVIHVPFWVQASETTGPPVRFTAKLDGNDARILETRDAASDQIILVVLDVTDNLEKVDAARHAFAQQLEELRGNAWVGLLRAQDGLMVLSDPTADRSKIDAAFEGIAVAGKSGLLDTIEQIGGIADAMARKSPVRVAVLYITDSNIYNYREDYTNPVINSSDPHDLSRKFTDTLIRGKVSRLSETLAQQETPVFIVHLNYRYDRLNKAYQNGLTTLAAATGGEAIFCRSTEEIQDAIARALSSIQSAWNMTIALPPKTPSTLQLKLSATAAGGAEVRLQYRARFAAPRR